MEAKEYDSVTDIQGGSGGNRLALKDGEKARVRFVGKIIEFQEQYEGEKPRTSFASVVIRRNLQEKTNEVMGYKFGYAVLKQIRSLAENADWGDLHKYDVWIERTGSGKNDTRYAVIPVPPLSAISEAEKQLVEAEGIDLKQLYAPRELPRDDPPTEQSSEEYDPFGDGNGEQE